VLLPDCGLGVRSMNDCLLAGWDDDVRLGCPLLAFLLRFFALTYTDQGKRTLVGITILRLET
jgi:hypothetical protein